MFHIYSRTSVSRTVPCIKKRFELDFTNSRLLVNCKINEKSAQNFELPYFRIFTLLLLLLLLLQENKDKTYKSIY